MKQAEPNWLKVEHIHPVHEALLARFGGASGIRDAGALAAALDRPRNRFLDESPSLVELAACYAFGLVKNHPFVDGNKRIGFMAAYIFLGINGLQLTAPEEEAVLHTLALAAGELSEAEYAAWLEKSAQPRD